MERRQPRGAHEANEHEANEHEANEHEANEHEANEHEANEHEANEHVRGTAGRPGPNVEQAPLPRGGPVRVGHDGRCVDLAG
jgi:hypothetical protein